MFKNITDCGLGPTPIKYINLKRLSASAITAFRKSPRNLLLKETRPPSNALNFGKAFHLALSEPEKYQESLGVFPEFPRKSKTSPLSADENRAKYIKDNPDLVFLTPEEKDKIKTMVDACSDNEIMDSILKKESKVIEIHFWIICEGYGEPIIVHGYLDLFLGMMGLVADIKTTKSTKKEQWEKAVFDYEYQIQAALYVDAMNAIFEHSKDPEVLKIITGTVDKFCWMCIQNAWPWNNKVYFADFGALEVGRELIKYTIPKVLDCLNNPMTYLGQEKLESCSLPYWAWAKYDKELENGE